VLDESGAARAATGDRAMFNHVVVMDTQVIGRWKRTVTRDSVAIEMGLHAPYEAAVDIQALHAAAERHAAFLGLDLGRLTTRRY
jgi:hypothetical protein